MRPLVGPIETQGSCTASATQLNIRELTRVSHQIYAAIPQSYIDRHILTMSTRYLAVDATPGVCIKYSKDIKYDVI